MSTLAKQEIVNFWDKHAAPYSSNFGHGFSSPEEIDLWLRILNRHIPQSLRGRALDLGTGPGLMAFLVATIGFDVTGVDLSEEMLSIARKNALEADLKIDFKSGDAQDPPFTANSFDLIICRHIMWTLPDMNQALERWQSILKPGGGLVIVDGVWYPNTAQGRMRRLAAGCIEAVKTLKLPGDWRKEYISDQTVLPHINGAHPDTVENAVRNNGFTAVQHDSLDDLIAFELRHAPLEYRIQYCHTPRYLIFGQKTA